MWLFTFVLDDNISMV